MIRRLWVLFVCLALAGPVWADGIFNPGPVGASPQGGSVFSLFSSLFARTASVTDYGAVCDAATKTSGTAAASSTTYSGGSYSFLSTDIGKAIQIAGAGTGGAALATTISNVAAGSAVLANAPSNNASGSTYNAYVAFPRTAGNATNSYAPGDTVTVAGGTSTTPSTVSVLSTTLMGGTIGGTMTGYIVGDVIYLNATGGTQQGQPRLLVTGVSAGAITSFQIMEGGVFTGNATSFTQAISGTAGSGFQLTSPIFGIYQVSVATPGVYTALTGSGTLLNASQASTSGSGAGATFDVYFSQGGGFTFGTDNAPAFNSAVTNAISTGWPVLVPSCPGGFGLASTVVVNSPFVVFRGVAPMPQFNGSTNSLGAVGSAVNWLGAAGGTMIQYASVAGGSNLPINGDEVDNLTFFGNGVAAFGLQILSANTFIVKDTAYQDFTSAGLNISVISGSLATEKCSQNFTVQNLSGSFLNAAGDFVRFNSTSGAVVCDASYGTVQNVYGNYLHGRGIVIQNSGHIWVKQVQELQRPGGRGNGFEIGCVLGGLADNAGSITIDGLNPGGGGMIIRGTEACPQSAPAIINANYNVTDGPPYPMKGLGGQHTLTLEDGHVVGQRSHGEVYFTGSNPVGGTIGVTSSGSNASGSYTLVLSSAANLSANMVSIGNAGIPDGTAIQAIATNTLTLTAPLSSTISNGTSLTFFAALKTCPENGGGLIVDGALYTIDNNCLWEPTKNIAGYLLPVSTSYYHYAGVVYSRVTGAASSDATRNLVRLTLDTTAGFQTGDEVRCFGVTGTTEANSGVYTPITGNIVDSTHIDLQGQSFSNAYTGGGYCWWIALFPGNRGHLGTNFGNYGNIQIQNGNPAFTLLGANPTTSSGGNPYFSQSASNSTTAGPASWFNRKQKTCVATLSSGTSNASGTTTYAEVSSNLRCFFFVWNDPFNPSNVETGGHWWSAVGQVANNTGGDGCATSLSSGASGNQPQQAKTLSGTTASDANLSGLVYGLGEGTDFLSVQGASITGGQCTWQTGYTLQVTSWQ